MDSPLRDMKYFDAFSGYGGFSLGIQKAYVDSATRSEERGSQEDTERNKGQRFQSEEGEDTATQDGRDSEHDRDISDERQPHCVGYSEIDKYASQVYQKHFPYEQCEKCRIENERQSEMPSPGDSEGQRGEQSDNGSEGLTCNCKHKPYGSITAIDASTLPDFDLFVGGFPCQAFSIAGKRGGFEDTRGTLIYDVLRIVKEKHPRFVLLENVKGLLSHDGGRTFKTIITSLAELGYAVEWQVLNAKNFGVPQNRERVFIIGHLGGFGGRQVFPIGEGEKSDIQPTKELPVQISNTLRTNYSNGFSNETYTEQDFRIRRLTPLEAERLMGLPDGWTEGVSDTQRYKLCGNGVVVNVVEEIVKRLI